MLAENKGPKISDSSLEPRFDRAAASRGESLLTMTEEDDKEIPKLPIIIFIAVVFGIAPMLPQSKTRGLQCPTTVRVKGLKARTPPADVSI